MPPRLPPHERPIPHCPPAPQVHSSSCRSCRSACDLTTAKAGRTREGSAAGRRAHSRRHLLVVDHDRAPTGGRLGACRGSAAA
eukprot:1653139-Prymnesium_polylepis.2